MSEASPAGRHGRLHVMTSQWVFTDALVLAAVRVCGDAQQPASLFDFVTAYDALHHMIATREEIEHAISLLVAAGLVDVGHQGFSVTEHGRALLARVYADAAKQSQGRLNHEQRNHAVWQELAKLPAQQVDWTLNQRDYEAACLEYQHTMRNEYRRSNRRYW